MPARPHRLLFVCTGNVCRSPMAEHLARLRAQETAVELEARSASMIGWSGEPAEPGMVRVGRELGLDLSAHAAQPVTAELVQWADHILVMQLIHYAALQEEFPESAGKVALLGSFGGVEEIADPIGAWFSFRYRRCRNELQRCVNAFVDRLPSEREED